MLLLAFCSFLVRTTLAQAAEPPANEDRDKAKPARILRLQKRLGEIHNEFKVLAERRTEIMMRMREAMGGIKEVRDSTESADKEIAKLRKRLRELEAEVSRLRQELKQREEALPRMRQHRRAQQDSVKELDQLREQRRTLLIEKRRLEKELRTLQSSGASEEVQE